MGRKKIWLWYSMGLTNFNPSKLERKDNIERKDNYYIVLWINLPSLLFSLFLHG